MKKTKGKVFEIDEMSNELKLKVGNFIEKYCKDVAKEIDDNTDFLYCMEIKRLFHKKEIYYFSNEEGVVNYLLENAWNKSKTRYTKVCVWYARRLFKINETLKKCKKADIKSFKEFMSRKENNNETKRYL